MSISFKSVIYCDDIRKEDNGKLLFIGVYSSIIHPYQFPANLRLAFWVTGQTTAPIQTVHFKLVIQPKSGAKSEEALFEPMEGAAPSSESFDKPVGVNFALTGVGIRFDEESDLILKARVEGGRWKQISSMPVLIHPSSGS